MFSLTVRFNSILEIDYNNQIVHVSMQIVLPPRNLSEMECLGGTVSSEIGNYLPLKWNNSEGKYIFNV